MGVVQVRSCNIFCHLTLEVSNCHFHKILLATEVSPIQCGRGAHRGMNTKRQESLRAILGTGYCGGFLMYEPIHYTKDLNK